MNTGHAFMAVLHKKVECGAALAGAPAVYTIFFQPLPLRAAQQLRRQHSTRAELHVKFAYIVRKNLHIIVQTPQTKLDKKTNAPA